MVIIIFFAHADLVDDHADEFDRRLVKPFFDIAQIAFFGDLITRDDDKGVSILVLWRIA